MALILPNPEDLQSYIEGPTQEEAIQQAMDLLVMATGLTSTSNTMEDRIVRSAVLEMAWAITIRHEDKEAEFSPFSSESIGSYSYSKAASLINQGAATGIPNFDVAIDYFAAQAMGGGISNTSSENVFVKDYGRSKRRHSYDPNTSSLINSASISGTPVYIENDNPTIGFDDDGTLYVIEE